MATKDVKARDDEDDDLDDEEDDDPDAGVPVPADKRAKGAAKSSAKPAAAKAARQAHGHGGHTKDSHGHDDDGVDDETRDPSWWLPYAVLGGIVVVGVLGFFGAFSSMLKPMFSPPKLAAETHEPPAVKAPEPPPEPAAPQRRPAPAAVDAETFGAKHLLVMYKGSKRAPATVTRTKEEALARAKEAHGKAKAPGAKFEDLVAEYSDEPGAAKRGGNLGNFRKGAMVKEFQDGLEKTKVGEISDVVETPFGYHVLLRTK